MSIIALNTIPRPVPIERRRARRIQLSLPIELELDDSKSFAQLVELSRTGARVAIMGVRPGAELIIRRAGVEVHGKIIWTNGSVAGLRFPEPIEETHFLQLRKRTV
ncbi:MAG: PilZ domain-containing protein [Allosphingosinicella sp.]